MSRLTITIAASVIVVLMGGYWLYPRIAMLATMRPLEKPFDGYPRPPAPNYADPSAWAALPGTEHPDAADLVPAGESIPDRQAESMVDVFYLHPTTYQGRENWNQDMADAKTNAWTDISVIARQAAIFNSCCRIYAPRYRQAASAAVYATDDSGDRARALAYEDVKAAFQHYLDRYNDGRPFILAGHSQGTFMIQKLLEEMIDASPIRPRLVAAYGIGIGFPVGVFSRQYKTISACAKPDDTGCVVSWLTYGRGGEGPPAVDRYAARYEARFKTREGAETLCINPLTFDTDKPDAPASANLGALPGVAAPGPLPALKPGVIGATCEKGILYVDVPASEDFKLLVLPGRNLHFHDMDLFFKNIRDNATLRAEAYLKAHGHAAN
jgi:predicted secreted protein